MWFGTPGIPNSDWLGGTFSGAEKEGTELPSLARLMSCPSCPVKPENKVPDAPPHFTEPGNSTSWSAQCSNSTCYEYRVIYSNKSKKIHIQTLLPLVKWRSMQIICVFQKHSNRTSLSGDIRCFEKQIKLKPSLYVRTAESEENQNPFFKCRICFCGKWETGFKPCVVGRWVQDMHQETC